MGRKKSSKPTSRPLAKQLPIANKTVRTSEAPLNHVAVAAALFVLVLLAWSNSFSGGFVLDNRFFILLDPRIHEATFANLALILNRGYWYTYNAGLYRPLTTLSYLFNYAILGNGEEPAGYHWINLLLHFANVLLVYALALRLLRKSWPAACIAAVWAVHPVLTESVTNIVGRADLLAGFAQLSGLLLYLKSTESTGWPRLRWLAGLMAVTTIGVFSKESAVAILGVIVLYELLWWNHRKQLRGLLQGCAAVAVPILVMLYVRADVLARSGPMEIRFTDNPLKYAGFAASRLTAVAVSAKYLWLLVWPARLSSDYSYDQIPLATGTVHDWIAWTAVIAVMIVAVFSFKWNRVACFFIGFAVISFIPTSNLLFPTGTMMAERFLYLPAIGFAACLVLAAYWMAHKIKHPQVAPIALGLLVAALGARTWARNADWHDNVALWTSAARAAPHSAKAHDALATVLGASDPSGSHIDQVLQEEEKSFAILSSLPDGENAAYVYANAGRLYSLKGDLLMEAAKSQGQSTLTPGSVAAYQRSAEILKRGLAIETNQVAHGAEAASSNLPFLYSSLALAYVRLGNYGEAYDAASRAASLSPLLADAYVSEGEALTGEQKKTDAVISFVEAFLLNENQGSLQLLEGAYRNELGSQDCAFLNTSQGPSLNIDCHFVHHDVCKASSNLTKQLVQDQNGTAAAEIKKRALDQLGCSATELNGD